MTISVMTLSCDRDECAPGAQRCTTSGSQEQCIEREGGLTYWAPSIWCKDICSATDSQNICAPLKSVSCPSTPSPALAPSGALRVDLDDDGITDRLFEGSAVGLKGMRLARGMADGSFGEAKLATSEDRPIGSWKLTDVNGDAFVDLVMAVAEAGFPIVLHLGDGKGQFAAATVEGSFALDRAPKFIVARLDATPFDHLIMSQGRYEHRGPNQIVGRWRSDRLLLTDPTELKSYEIFDAADIEALGTEQLLAYGEQALWAFRLAGGSLVGRKLAKFNDGQLWPLAAADLNGDGRPEVLLGGTSVTVVTVKQGGETATTIKSLGIPMLEDELTLFDLNVDGTLDLILSSTGGLRVALTRPNLTVAPPRLLTTTDGFDHVLDVGDFDNDGVPDLLGEKRSQNMATVPSVISGNCPALREGS